MKTTLRLAILLSMVLSAGCAHSVSRTITEPASSLSASETPLEAAPSPSPALTATPTAAPQPTASASPTAPSSPTAAPSATPITPSPTAVPSATLTTAPTATSQPTADPKFKSLKMGDQGANIGKLQARLLELDYPVCDQTGAFDLQTQAANGLPIDGIVGSWVWSVLFDPAAKPLPQPEAARIKFDKYTLPKKAWALAVGKSSLWYFSEQQVIQFNPATMRPAEAIDMPVLGQEKASDGTMYDIQFGPAYIFPPETGDQVWMIGGYGSGIGNPADAALSITTGGEVGVGPTLFPGTYGGVMDALQAGGEIWAFHQRSDDVIFYIVDPTGGLIPQAHLGGKFADTNAYTWDGGQLYALVAREGHALAPVDAYAGSYGEATGPCGADLAWDGEWLWVLYENQLRAYDTQGKLQAIADPPVGYEIREFTAGNGIVAAIAAERTKRYLILFEKE